MKKEIEQSVHTLMDMFTADSENDTDTENFELLKNIHGELMTKVVKSEKTEELSGFLRNFLEEFDNTYSEGLSEAIIASLKTGKRINLTEEWIQNENKKANT